MSLVPSPRRWTADYAAGVLHDLERSSLSMAAFARQRGFGVQRLRWWRARLRRLGHAPRVIELVPIRPAAPVVTGCLRVSCPSGHVIEATGVDLVTVLTVALRALGDVQC